MGSEGTLKARPGVWFASIATSVVLLALVGSQIEWHAAIALIDRIDYRWIGLGLGLLLLEGLVSAARFDLLTRSSTTYTAALQTTAWYVLLIIGLPARLGEIAGIALVVRYLKESIGAATANLLFQRSFDIIVLMSLSLVLAAVTAGNHSWQAVLVAVVVMVFATASLFFLENMLGCLAERLISYRNRAWCRRILRIVLQVRMFRRHHMDSWRSIMLATYTIAKWLVNLTAVACVVIAVAPDISLVAAIWVGIVYNVAAVIPLQTVGGFGISEAALLLSFAWLGYEFTQGAPIAIAIRMALLSAPILFWLIVCGVTRFRTPRLASQ